MSECSKQKGLGVAKASGGSEFSKKKGLGVAEASGGSDFSKTTSILRYKLETGDSGVGAPVFSECESLDPFNCVDVVVER